MENFSSFLVNKVFTDLFGAEANQYFTEKCIPLWGSFGKYCDVVDRDLFTSISAFSISASYVEYKKVPSQLKMQNFCRELYNIPQIIKKHLPEISDEYLESLSENVMLAAVGVVLTFTDDSVRVNSKVAEDVNLEGKILKKKSSSEDDYKVFLSSFVNHPTKIDTKFKKKISRAVFKIDDNVANDLSINYIASTLIESGFSQSSVEEIHRRDVFKALIDCSNEKSFKPLEKYLDFVDSMVINFNQMSVKGFIFGELNAKNSKNIVDFDEVPFVNAEVLLSEISSSNVVKTILDSNLQKKYKNSFLIKLSRFFILKELNGDLHTEKDGLAVKLNDFMSKNEFPLVLSAFSFKCLFRTCSTEEDGKLVKDWILNVDKKQLRSLSSTSDGGLQGYYHKNNIRHWGKALSDKDTFSFNRMFLIDLAKHDIVDLKLLSATISTVFMNSVIDDFYANDDKDLKNKEKVFLEYFQTKGNAISLKDIMNLYCVAITAFKDLNESEIVKAVESKYPNEVFKISKAMADFYFNTNLNPEILTSGAIISPRPEVFHFSDENLGSFSIKNFNNRMTGNLMKRCSKIVLDVEIAKNTSGNDDVAFKL